MKIYHERIKGLREDRDYKQAEIAKILNVRQNTYSQYENGVNNIPVDVIIELAKFYDVSSDYILGLSNNLRR